MKRIICVIFLVLTLAWLGFIFSNSLENGTESGEKSNTVHEVVNEIAQSLGATEEIPESTIRTSAHFLEFAVLGILLATDIALLLSLSPSAPLSRRHAWILLALPLSTALAVIDEIIQHFTPDRAMQFVDIAIDSAGALCGMLGVTAIFLLARCAHLRKERKQQIST